MVVIYKDTENIVIDRILKTVQNETNIVKDIFRKIDTIDIVKNRGTF